MVRTRVTKIIAGESRMRQQSGGGAALSNEEVNFYANVAALKQRQVDEEEEVKTRAAARLATLNQSNDQRNDLLRAALAVNSVRAA